jgi:hypothetical protein
VAHYLILTHLRESMPEMPLLDAVGIGSRKRGAAAAAGDEAAAAAGQPAAKRARTDACDPSRDRHVHCTILHRPPRHTRSKSGRDHWLPAAVKPESCQFA